ncbi:tol-pal system-associated acyl-CoA thioesterase [Halomonas campisalis]|uniref:Tol-pal system-associated acyl-CoA thioesterase n=1 Tax=Billgrantia campisalis TaxID=74661 RepID=A0ABS9P5Q5_9GAMM|nr:tol-pal system-associated acyl-CoA thioesterase [Halomonas campisalis]MCG6657094.1 tol-pal system-associated acyl-CoA thioesterase [Halomonas campisalis]MDR5862279.1 tol-pal system-associated acyl-CoA thioesterase [Halomonas campisalis]
MSEFRLPVRVYIEDTDAGGIVYYVNYLKFMERARSEWLRSHGITQRELFDAGIQLVVHRLECRYAKPARLDDGLEVSAAIQSHGRCRLSFAQTVRRGGEPLCDARVDIACLDAARLRPTPWPPALAAVLTG